VAGGDDTSRPRRLDYGYKVMPAVSRTAEKVQKLLKIGKVKPILGDYFTVHVPLVTETNLSLISFYLQQEIKIALTALSSDMNRATRSQSYDRKLQHQCCKNLQRHE
jgi:hypothetical protein